MKFITREEHEVEVTHLLVQAGVRYWEDSDVNGEKDDEDGTLIPLKKGSCWCPKIDLETGVIEDWPKGTTASIHYKVCDAGCYYLLDAEGNTVASLEQEYVPKMMCPKSPGYGDYIIMDIDEDGKIDNWTANLDEFEQD